MSDQQEGRKPPKPASLVRPQGVTVPTIREHKWDENYVCGADMAEPGKVDKTVIKFKCGECGADIELELNESREFTVEEVRRMWDEAWHIERHPIREVFDVFTAKLNAAIKGME